MMGMICFLFVFIEKCRYLPSRVVIFIIDHALHLSVNVVSLVVVDFDIASTFHLQFISFLYHSHQIL